MALYDVPAPAKLNLFLHVTGRRADGYHELQTVFRFVGLYDRMDFDLRNDGRIEREGVAYEVPADQDLVVRAARALQQATGARVGAQIRYDKQIPAGAGLGGGSSDAATTLIALNRLWKTGLDRASLIALGRTLGADVPIFLFGRPAFAGGIGDEFTEVELPERGYFILRPSGSVATPEIFSDPDLTRNTESVIISVFTDWQTDQAHQKAGPQGHRFFGRNDLQPVVIARHQNIRQMADDLRKQGFHARMTGSGNCFFVEYDTQEQAGRAQRDFSSKMLESTREGQANAEQQGLVGHKSSKAVVEATWACPGLLDHPLRHW